MTDAEALDRIQAVALLWAQGKLGEEEAMAQIIMALEKVGRPIIED
jgi:hypothetical protein